MEQRFRSLKSQNKYRQFMTDSVKVFWKFRFTLAVFWQEVNKEDVRFALHILPDVSNIG